jgi:hypothetical protein
MAYGKSSAASASKVIASAPGVYPRTITFAGPKSKRTLKAAGRKTLGKRK